MLDFGCDITQGNKLPPNVDNHHDLYVGRLEVTGASNHVVEYEEYKMEIEMDNEWYTTQYLYNQDAMMLLGRTMLYEKGWTIERPSGTVTNANLRDDFWRMY